LLALTLQLTWSFDNRHTTDFMMMMTMTMKAVDLLVSGAADGGVQHCGSGVEAEQR